MQEVCASLAIHFTSRTSCTYFTVESCVFSNCSNQSTLLGRDKAWKARGANLFPRENVTWAAAGMNSIFWSVSRSCSAAWSGWSSRSRILCVHLNLSEDCTVCFSKTGKSIKSTIFVRVRHFSRINSDYLGVTAKTSFEVISALIEEPPMSDDHISLDLLV